MAVQGRAAICCVEQLLDGVVVGHPSCGDIRVGVALHLLPALRPEPGLVSGYRRQWVQLDDLVLPLDDAYLRSGLVQVVPSTQVGRKRKGSAV